MCLVSTDHYYCNLINSIISSWKDKFFCCYSECYNVRKHFLFNLSLCARMV